MELPDKYEGLRRFLGMVGFYRRFIPSYANITAPLYSLLTTFDKTPKHFQWVDDAKVSFNTVKQALADSVLLFHPSSTNCPFHIVTDASAVAVGAALHQTVDGNNVPLAFFSKRLSQQQRAYSAFDRELLAAYLTVIHFRHFIEGRTVTLYTDHKPLVSAFFSQTPCKSDRQQRHLSVVSEYVSHMEYIRGTDNVVADTLSRCVNSVELDFPDLSTLASAQQTDTELSEYKDRLKSFPLSNGKEIFCDVTSTAPRPFVPESKLAPLMQISR